jgi:hypothetical protein
MPRMLFNIGSVVGSNVPFAGRGRALSLNDDSLVP